MAWFDRFKVLTAKTHSEQAIWWLNGFWAEGAEEYAEDVWKTTHSFIECQIDAPVLHGSKKQQYTEESDLDEFKSHRILEILGETTTVVELRKRLKALDIDKNKRMAISEYLIDKYKKMPEALVDSPQGEVDPVKLAAAEALFNAACDALDEASEAASEAAKAVIQSQSAAAAAARAKTAADDALASSQDAEAKVRAAEAELQATVDEISALEKAKEDKIAKCQKIIDDPSAGNVKKGKAVQEKEQTLCEDPLPLRKAKITQQAALKRVTKARTLAEAETAKSTAAAQAAHDAKEEADQAEVDAKAAKEKADKAKVHAEEALAEAEEALNEIKRGGEGAPMGKLWWMDRILKEKKKYSK